VDLVGGKKDPFEIAMIIFAFIFMFSLIIAIVFECWIFYESYAHADKIECAWYGCIYTTTVRETQINTTIESHSISSRNCFENGAQVNCSEVAG
jgi:hypothetical protein